MLSSAQNATLSGLGSIGIPLKVCPPAGSFLGANRRHTQSRTPAGGLFSFLYGRFMACPQTKDGYTRIANEIMDALIKTDIRIPPEARKVLDLVLRETYGFSRKSAKFKAGYIAKNTCLSRQNARRALNRLEKMRLVTVVRSDYGVVRSDYAIEISIQKDYEKWVPYSAQSDRTTQSDLTTGVVRSDSPPYKETIKKPKTPPTPPRAGGVVGGVGDQNGFFDQFWSAYPRKVAKQAAVKAFKKIKKPADLMPAILAAIKAQRETYDWQKEDGQFIPYPATWLNGHRWEDKIECEITKQPTGKEDFYGKF